MESPVEFAALELQKENILPLTGGRSAAQLVSLSSQTRSGLGDKLATEHARYQAALAALEAYDAGATETAGYTAEELGALAEDPLDLHHQYARFVLNSYPAGPSSASRLLPLLESSTRRFLDDERYTNDPRYLRLWNLYARNIERPEECYRFLFAKRIGERLAVLYEEYALVLEAAGKRHQADQIYLLGIARLAVPLDRLRKRHQAFQARMLVAPPLPSTPPPSSPTPTTAPLARPILAGHALVPTVPTSNSGPTISNAGGRENGSRGFNVFQDTAASTGVVGEDAKGGWDDFGTVKSRKRENEVEAKEWKGETLPMGSKAVGTGFKLDVFRDNDTPITPAKSLVDQQDVVLLRSIRGPSEGELLRLNPFKNYSEGDLGLSAIDPLLNLPLPPIASTSASTWTAGVASTTTGPTKPRLKSTSSSTSVKKSSSSSSGSKAASTSKVSSTGTEKVACDLKAIYPAPGIEISFEELKLRSNASYSIEGMYGWEYTTVWREEIARKGMRSWLCDPLTGWPVLYSPKTGLPLYDFLAPPTPPSPPHLSPELQNIPLPPPESPPYHQIAPNAFDSPPGSPGEMTRKFRVPSPTMNTREAQAMMDGLFSKTLNFEAGAVREEDEESGSEEGSGDGSEESESESGSGSEEGEGQSFVFNSQPVAVTGAPAFVLHSDLDHPQQSSHNDLTPESPLRPFAPSDQNGPQELSSTRANQGGFRPVARTPLGAKSVGPGAGAGLGGRAFEVAADPIPISSTASTSSSDQEQEYDDEDEGEEYGDSTAPLRSAQFSTSHQQQQNYQPSERHFSPNGFSMGRRAVGTNRYAPLIDNMTPITERTAEYNTYSISKSGFKGFGAGVGPRVSVAPDVRGVLEEDEEEEESSTEDEDEEGEEGGDRAFVAGGEMQSTDEGDSSQTEDDEYESQESQSQGPVPILLPSLQSPLRPFVDPIIPSAVRQPTTTTTNEIDSSADGTLFSNVENTAGDVVVPIADLSEGYTISGNQSGMITGTVAETTIIKTVDSELLSMDSLSIDDGRNEAIDDEEEEAVDDEEVDVADFANPCNPFDADIIESRLSRCSPSLESLPNVHDLTHLRANKLDDLQQMAKRRIEKGTSSRSSGGGKDRTGLIEDIWSLELDGQVFSVREKLGEGSFGAVFRIAIDSPSAANGSEDRSFDDDDQEDEEAEGSVAVKVERPTNRWEFYILSQLASRLPSSLLPSVVSAKSLYLYKDESYLFLDFSDQGTLLDAVNSANDSGTAPPTSSASSGLEEILAIFFTVELLRVVEGFHSAGIVHGDLKIDNCLVRLGEVSGRDWKATYDETGAGGWAKKGVRVIDFGRSVDVASFNSTTTKRPEQRFKTNFVTSSFDCPEMQEKRSWTYEPDYFGVASIAFTLLFGRFIETTTSTDSLFYPASSPSTPPRQRYIISQNFKRYQQAELWGKLFHALLNPSLVRREAGGEGSEIREELRVVRGEMEDWLRRNSDKGGKSLKGLLKKMEMYSLTRFGR